jgi:hypothetical protein
LCQKKCRKNQQQQPKNNSCQFIFSFSSLFTVRIYFFDLLSSHDLNAENFSFIALLVPVFFSLSVGTFNLNLKGAKKEFFSFAIAFFYDIVEKNHKK